MIRSIKTEPARIIVVSHMDMMRYYDPVRIQAYCRSCEKYGLFWSCPPFDATPLEQLPAWTHAVLITQKTWVDSGSTNERLFGQFLAVRQSLSDTLKPLEIDGALAVIAGHCSGCSVCTRSKGIACCAPARMRYSLEALGFDVTGLAEALAGQKMDWPPSGMPRYLLIVGALLCPSPDVATRIIDYRNRRQILITSGKRPKIRLGMKAPLISFDPDSFENAVVALLIGCVPNAVEKLIAKTLAKSPAIGRSRLLLIVARTCMKMGRTKQVRHWLERLADEAVEDDVLPAMAVAVACAQPQLALSLYCRCSRVESFDCAECLDLAQATLALAERLRLPRSRNNAWAIHLKLLGVAEELLETALPGLLNETSRVSALNSLARIHSLQGVSPDVPKRDSVFAR